MINNETCDNHREVNTLDQMLIIENTLKKYQFLWDKEPIDYYPNLPSNTLGFISELQNYSSEELIELENLNAKARTPLLSELFKDISDSLLRINQLKQEGQINQNELRGLSVKKCHEIKRLIPILEELSPTLIHDIGSGKAPLSFLMAQRNLEMQFKCYDLDKTLQASAIKKNQNNMAIKRINFIHQTISSKSQLDLKERELLFGLHACGDLSIDLIKILIKEGTDLFNIPCCFHKQTKQNLSGHQNLKLNKFALTLANRGQINITPKALSIRNEYKAYRYALQMIYFNKYEKQIMSLGNAHKSWYQLSFHDYVKKYDQDLFYLDNLNKSFYALKKTINDYLLIEVIRNPLGRLLEQYLLLDRILYLEKHNFKVELIELFNNELSPKNIALKATKSI